jgi:hypothetical protein
MERTRREKLSVDTNSENGIMLTEEVARYLRKSSSWVYKNWQILGGVKLGGSLLFPGKEDLNERLFGKGERVAIRLHPERDQVHGRLVQNKVRCKASSGEENGGYTKPESDSGNPDRHGLLGTGEQKARSCEGI